MNVGELFRKVTQDNDRFRPLAIEVEGKLFGFGTVSEMPAGDRPNDQVIGATRFAPAVRTGNDLRHSFNGISPDAEVQIFLDDRDGNAAFYDTADVRTSTPEEHSEYGQLFTVIVAGDCISC